MLVPVGSPSAGPALETILDRLHDTLSRGSDLVEVCAGCTSSFETTGSPKRSSPEVVDVGLVECASLARVVEMIKATTRSRRARVERR
jgi:hypothetical protein